MLKLKSVKTDLKAEREGDWVDYPEWPGVRFKVKSLQCPEFVEARGRLMRKLAKKYKGDPIPLDETTKELGTLVANIILLGWDGLDEPYTPERASEVLTDPSYRKVADAVQFCANIVGDNDEEFVEAAAKN